MSLSDLAAVGSFISGIAVFLSFIFLALQLRQANRNQRSLMQQARTGSLGGLSARVPLHGFRSEGHGGQDRPLHV